MGASMLVVTAHQHHCLCCLRWRTVPWLDMRWMLGCHKKIMMAERGRKLKAQTQMDTATVSWRAMFLRGAALPTAEWNAGRTAALQDCGYTLWLLSLIRLVSHRGRNPGRGAPCVCRLLLNERFSTGNRPATKECDRAEERRASRQLMLLT